MKIKDQIKARREQLGVSVLELARRVGVSGQAVRNWELGKAHPAKNKAALVESALSFVLDWTEGTKPASVWPQMAALINPRDIELLMLFGRLPPQYKEILESLAKLHLAAIIGDKRSFTSRVDEQPVPAFNSKEKGRSIDSALPKRTKPATGGRRKAA